MRDEILGQNNGFRIAMQGILAEYQRRLGTILLLHNNHMTNTIAISQYKVHILCLRRCSKLMAMHYEPQDGHQLLASVLAASFWKENGGDQT